MCDGAKLVTVKRRRVICRSDGPNPWIGVAEWLGAGRAKLLDALRS